MAQETSKDIRSKLDYPTPLYQSIRKNHGEDIAIRELGVEKTFSLLKSESDSLSALVFTKIPPLHPSRLARRMKILYGLDIANYNRNDLVYLGNQSNFGYTLFDTDSGLVWIRPRQDEPVYGDMVPANFSLEEYTLFYQYIMYNDTEALNQYYDIVKDTFGNDWDCISDFVYSIYKYSYFFNYTSAMKYLEESERTSVLLKRTNPYFSNQQLDAAFIYLTLNSAYLMGDSDERNIIRDDYSNDPDKSNTPLIESTWYKDKISYYQSIAAWLSFYVKLNKPIYDKKVIKFLYEDEKQPGHIQKRKPIRDKLKQTLVENNYFGYTVLREFLENPLRETPSIEKLGIACKRASVKTNNLLLLEPSEISYTIDTIMPHEQFIAYEMGHDDYYYIEIEKPVESPVAGPDGYAAFMGRTEIVRGYLPKNKVVKISGETLLAMNKYNNLSKSRKGIINDPDGYVNIRSEENVQSPVLGKIMEGDVFYYWETDSNWYIVQTENGIRGFVYKTRIEEKVKDERWTP